jgi:hypothetical protein
LTIGNFTEIGTGYQVTNWIDFLGIDIPDITTPGAGANSSFYLGITDLLIVDDPNSGFDIGMLLQAFTPPGAHYKISTLANALLGPTAEGIIDTKVGNIFNLVFAGVDALIGGQMDLLSPPYVVQQPEMPDALNLRTLDGPISHQIQGLLAALIKDFGLQYPNLGNIHIDKLVGTNLTLDLGKFLAALPATLRITLKEVNVTGLDKIVGMQPKLQPLCEIAANERPAICDGGGRDQNNQTIRTTLGLETLGLHLLASIEVLDDATGSTLSDDTMRVDIAVESPKVNIDAIVDLSRAAIRTMQMKYDYAAQNVICENNNSQIFNPCPTVRVCRVSAPQGSPAGCIY